ncbi:helix-turn-helix domain-containing protein [Desulfoplanes sp. PS50]
MSMQELGELFKTARQDAGLSLQEVYERTKISLYVLESLEKGDVARLPHPVYTKGFIRNYANLLGLDQDKVVHEYLAVVEEPDDPLDIDPGVPELNVRRKTKSRAGTFRLIVFGLAILAAVVWLIGSYVSREIKPVSPVVMEQDGSSDLETPAPLPVTEEEDEPAVAEDASEKGAGTDQMVTDEAAEAVDDRDVSSSQQPEAAGVDEKNNDQAGTVSDQAVSRTSEISRGNSLDGDQKDMATQAVSPVTSSVGETRPDVSASKPEVVTKAHVMRVEATHECWLSATADRKTALDKTVRLLKPGQSVNIPFNENVELRLGNAGGVRLFVDAEPYLFEGDLGVVKSLVVSAPAE